MNLENIKTIKDLENISSISSEDINKIIKSKKEFIEEKYISKKNGGTRKIYEIKKQSYTELLRFLNKEFTRLYIYNDCIHGFVKGKGIISNAKEHLNKKIVINLDIKNFFNSIKYDDILTSLNYMGLHKEIIPTILNIITINDILPTGFSTSPTISNIICNNLDKDFKSYAEENLYNYTRYGDDITLSTNKTNYLKKEDLIKILKKYGFILNEKKYKVQKKGGNMYVTGLTVCEKDKPRVPKYIKKNIRQEIYYIQKFGYEEHIKKIGEENTLFKYGESSIEGWSRYLNKLEPNLSKYINEKLLLM